MTIRDELLVLAAQIISAHVANNTVVPGDVSKLIHEVYRALIDAGHPSKVAATAEPAVPVKRSVTPDHLICLERGKHFLDVETASRDRSSADPRSIPAEMGLGAIIPNCGAKLRQNALCFGEENWLGTHRKDEADAKKTWRVGQLARGSCPS